MSAYVETVFGFYGRALLVAIITLACLVTAIGLTSYFNQTTGVSYGLFVTLPLTVSVGLNSLTEMVVPVLCVIYPAALIVVANVNFRSSLRTDLLLSELVRAVPAADVMLINDEMIRLDVTFSQFLLQNDNDNWEP
jgi:branched-subunit amino acid permease